MKLKYYTKEMFKVTKIMIFAFMCIIAVILIKYKPVYKVSVSGVEVGYIKNKNEFNADVNNMIEQRQENVAFNVIENMPEYELKFVNDIEKTNEEEILISLKEDMKTTYTMYAITLDGTEETYVKNEEEASHVVENLKNQLDEEKFELGIRQIYTEEEKEIKTVEVATTEIKNASAESVKKEDKQKSKLKKDVNVNGITIANRPVTGTITARYGVVSRVRSGAHTGLDIAAKTGTPIYACSDGTVTFAGTKGSYGKLVKISHGNGVETWYAHCSKIYVSKGDKVYGGQKIAAVGSTGNSTGPHLHLEIRINGKAVNPQKYLYK